MLSVCIPTMKRWPFLKDTIPLILEQNVVSEIIICDETGEDIEKIKNSPFGTNTKIHLIQNEKRLGIYENKKKVASLAKSPWVAILDSDNIFPKKWFDDIEDVLKNHEGRNDIIFASASFININLETRQTDMPCVHFDGMKISKENWNSIFSIPRWNFLLNDGNWIVPKDSIKYLPNVKSSSLEAADAIFMLKCWISEGLTIYYVPQLQYIHTVHSGSSWIATEKESTRIFNQSWKI